MPIYRYRCSACCRGLEVFKKIADIDSITECPQCKFPMNRQICAPAVRGDYPGYDCPITGKWIEGKRAHIENLKQHGCRVYEPGETESFKRQKAAEEAAFDAQIEATAEQFVMALPTAKREQLAAELDNGLDVEFTRTANGPGL